MIKISEPEKKIETLFVWPEGIFSGYRYEDLLYFKEMFSQNFGDNHLILFGVNKLDKKNNGVYNSLIIVNKKFEIVKEYNKQKLVPFG